MGERKRGRGGSGGSGKGGEKDGRRDVGRDRKGIGRDGKSTNLEGRTGVWPGLESLSSLKENKRGGEEAGDRGPPFEVRLDSHQRFGSLLQQVLKVTRFLFCCFRFESSVVFSPLVCQLLCVGTFMRASSVRQSRSRVKLGLGDHF